MIRSIEEDDFEDITDAHPCEVARWNVEHQRARFCGEGEATCGPVDLDHLGPGV